VQKIVEAFMSSCKVPVAIPEAASAQLHKINATAPKQAVLAVYVQTPYLLL